MNKVGKKTLFTELKGKISYKFESILTKSIAFQLIGLAVLSIGVAVISGLILYIPTL